MSDLGLEKYQDIGNFDDEADVLIVGFGIAGACAALEARRLGGDVLVVERASAGGGASSLSSGLFYLGGAPGFKLLVDMKTAPRTCTVSCVPAWEQEMLT